MFRLIKRQKGEKIVWTLEWRDIIKDNCYMPITHIKGFKWWPHKKYVEREFFVDDSLTCILRFLSDGVTDVLRSHPDFKNAKAICK